MFMNIFYNKRNAGMKSLGLHEFYAYRESQTENAVSFI